MPFDLVKALRRLCPRSLPGRPQVSGHRPIERIAADLRRVRRSLACFEPGTSAAKKIGARQAYDALLVQACAALDVEHRLHVLPQGVDREVERLRVEECLRRQGLSV
ncbi:hypothetical protein SAMN05216188_117165 [Lentzea xinjiangensis]|uniref:Uncharacterized protein n=1 Tax=Lentzea xinjiangensis TaxID=402600 RepID=A0A1H9T6V8_9PSEU|nr:hypothetical protein [Lentzea xinjiangensis]SER92499.1 hypothetical protein SAMN05216188_117165 [Lentzea xinjiangensis]